jgi:hypothetical protein
MNDTKFCITGALEWAELWDAMDASPEAWVETTEKMYWQMLECLPPRKMSQNAFLVGEPLRHNERGAVHACFLRVGGVYWAKNINVSDFAEVSL